MNSRLAGIEIIAGKKNILFWGVLVILIIRLLFIGIMGPMPQDAYYYFYSAHPALSYYDHPPAIAYLLKLFTFLFGKKVFALKLADSVVTFFSVVAFYKLAQCFLSNHRAGNAFLLFFSTFMVTILSLVSTPDTPLILFWILSLLALYHAVFLQKNIYWVWSGILMGLAFDSKYTAILLPFGIILFILLSNQYRKLIFSPWLCFSIILFIITALPVIIWNVQNGFASFKFQSSGRVQSMSDGTHINIVNFFGVIGHQSAILMPVLFLSFFVFLSKAIKKYHFNPFKVDAQKLFLLSFFIPTFAGFLGISFVSWVKLNWMMPAYISGIIWIALYFNTKWIRVQIICSLALHILGAIEILFYPVPVKSDDTWMGWKQLADKVSIIKTNYPNSFIFSADDYKTTAELNFYSDGEMIYARNVIGEPALQFDFIGTDLNKLKGRDALFIDSNPGFSNEQKENKIPTSLTGYFDSVTELDPILIKNGDRTVRKFLVYQCKNYHPGK
jgi:4-amino-4-deoxy-L-arabinose transferase-like glycosyltransferase